MVLLKLLLAMLLIGAMLPVTAQETPEPIPMAEGIVLGELPEQPAYVRFAHFVPEAPAVAIALDDEMPLFTGLEYGSVTPWRAVPASVYTVTLTPVNEDEADALISQKVNLALNTWSTVLVTRMSETDDLSMDVVLENFDFDAMLPGTANITFVNASTMPSVNFNRDAVVFFSSLTPVGESDGAYSYSATPIDTGVYDFSTYDGRDATTLLGELPEMMVVDTTVYLFALIGTAENLEFVVFPTTEAEAELLRGELQPPGTLVQAAQANDLLEPFADAIEIAGLTETLQGEGPYTIFAPVDFVMDDLVVEYQDDPEALAALLEAHIVEGDLKSTEVFNASSLTNLAGETLSITPQENGVGIEGNLIVDVNIAATNGTIHIINGYVEP